LESVITILSESEKELTLSYTAEEIKPELEAEIVKQVKKIQIDGFRKGKAPMHVIKRIYGDALEYDAAEKISNKLFWDNVKSQNLNPIGEPALVDMKFKPGEDFSFKVRFEVYPVIEIKDYKDNQIDIPDLVASDVEVNQEIRRIQFSNAINEPADVVENENFVIDVDLQRISKEGTQIEGAVQKGVKIQLFNENVNKEIVENAKDKKVGETFSFSFHDHSDHHHTDNEENHDDHTYIYNATIKSIEKVTLPELNEEFIKRITREKASNESEMRENILKDIQSYYDSSVEEMTDLQLEKKLLENNKFTPPSTFVENYLNELVKQETEKAKQEKKRFPDVQKLRESLKVKAENSVKWILLRDEIMKKENINLTDERIEEIAKENSEKIGVSTEILTNYYKSDEMKSQLLTRELYKFLRENNKITKIHPDEYNKQMKNT
jgi:trigger factor